MWQKLHIEKPYPDMVIDDTFPWHTQPLRIRLTNNTRNDKLLTKNTVIGTLKPLVSPALAKKLSDSQLSDVHIIKLPDDDTQQEELFINSLIENLHGNEEDLLNALGDKRKIGSDGTTDSDVPQRKQNKIQSPSPPESPQPRT